MTNHGRLVFPYLDGCDRVSVYGGRVHIDYDGEIECTSTSGVQDLGVECDCCGEMVDPDTLSTVADGSAVCEYCIENEYSFVDSAYEYYPNDEVVYSDYVGEYLLNEEAIYADGIEDYINECDTIEVSVRVDGETRNIMRFPDDYDISEAARIVADNA